MKQPQQEQENRPRQATEEEEEGVVALRWWQYPGPETDSAKNGIGKRGGVKLEGTDESTERTQSTGNVYVKDEEVEIIEEIEEKLDVEGVLRKQNTHDLLCPYCNSCITRTVILRTRIKRKPAGNLFDEPTEADDKVITDSDSCPTPTPAPTGNVFDEPADGVVIKDPNNRPIPTPAPDEQDKDEKLQEAIKCLSCFSFCFRNGDGIISIFPFPQERPRPGIPSAKIPGEDQIPSDGTKCWLFGIFTSGNRQTRVEQDYDAGRDVEAAGPAVVTDPMASQPRGLEILKSTVYGGLIESITSLGVVSSAAGGGASTLNILALGLANLISGLIILIHSLSDLKNDRSGAGGVISETDTQEDRYQELLGRRENFCLHTTVSILSYLIFGLVPPVVYGFSFRQSNDTDFKLAAVAAASFVCIILLAVGKAYVGKPRRSYFRTVLFYVIAGFSASGVSFLVGELVRKLLEKLGWFESSSDLIMPLLEAKPFEGAWASF